MHRGATSGGKIQMAAGGQRRPVYPGLIFLLLAGPACTTTVPAEATPAVITASGPLCQAQIKAVIADALGGPVTLASGVLTDTSQVLVEQKHLRDATGRMLDGRLTGRPHSFSLKRSDGKCLLENDRTAQRTLLSNCSCRRQAY